MIASILASILALSPFDAKAPCRGCSDIPDRQEEKNLFVFLSFSVPLETWKDLSSEMKKTGGSFILRGVPKDSFELFALKVVQLREEGVSAPIELDPDLFNEYGITEVPTLVVTEGEKLDLIRGNLRLADSLRLLSSEGDAKEYASELLAKLHE